MVSQVGLGSKTNARNSKKTESRLVIARGQGKGSMVSDCLRCVSFPFGVMKMFRN